jgi:hypothetical protein
MITFSPNPAQGPGIPQTQRPEPEQTSVAKQPAPEPGAAGQELASRQPAQSQMKRKPTLGQVLVMAAGILMFVWSFLPWYSDPGQRERLVHDNHPRPRADRDVGPAAKPRDRNSRGD